ASHLRDDLPEHSPEQRIGRLAKVVKRPAIQVSEAKLVIQCVERVRDALEQRCPIGQGLLLSLLDGFMANRLITYASGLQHRDDAHSQLTFRIRLGQIAVGSQLESLDPLLINRAAGDQQYRDGLSPSRAAQGLEQLDAINI